MQLTHSLLSGLVPSGTARPGRETATPTDAGKPGGDFSGLLSLLTPKAAMAETAQPAEGESAPLPTGEAEAVAVADPIRPSSGSAMPPVAASGKILPVSLPEGLPVADAAGEGEHKAETPAKLSQDTDTPEAPVPAEKPGMEPVVLAIAIDAAPIVAEAATQNDSEAPTVGDPEDSPEQTSAGAEQPTSKIAMIAPELSIPASIAASIEANPAEEPPKAKAPAQPKTTAAVSAAALTPPIAASAAIAAEGGAEGQAASSPASAPAPAPAPAPAGIARQTAAEAETQTEVPKLATPARGPEAAPAPNAAAPTLTLRMAQREEAQPPAVDLRPASMERQAVSASTAPAPRFAAMAQAEIERPKAPAATPAFNPSTLLAGPTASVASDAAPAVPVFRMSAPVQEPMADLAQIVDRLAAAREAVAPARAALAIEHAEFGELTLRFEQRHDGRLTAELAGANAEAHRAVSQAFAADRNQSAGQDSGNSQQQQSQSSNHAARASGGDRDASGNGGGNAQDQRQETARQRAGRSPQQARPQGGSTQQGGVFA